MRSAQTMMCLVLVWSLAPVTASAGPPDPTLSTVPALVRVVGYADGIPDPSGSYTVVVRDFTGAPCPGVPVTLDFSACSDIRLSYGQVANVTLVPASNAITVVTNLAGQAPFTVIGAGSAHACGAASCPAGPGAGCVKVCAAGVPLGTATANVYDLDGATAPIDMVNNWIPSSTATGINAVDIRFVQNEVTCALLGSPYRARCDYQFNLVINSGDLAFYLGSVAAPAARGRGSVHGSGGAPFFAGPFVPFPCP